MTRAVAMDFEGLNGTPPAASLLIANLRENTVRLSCRRLDLNRKIQLPPLKKTPPEKHGFSTATLKPPSTAGFLMDKPRGRKVRCVIQIPLLPFAPHTAARKTPFPSENIHTPCGEWIFSPKAETLCCLSNTFHCRPALPP